ncbi:MAG: XRE family transcriptional regulator [Ideonella sp.]|nr:XRE family transcriptional regulator [Ideonella sp.]
MGLASKNQRCHDWCFFANIYVMPKRSQALIELPPAVRSLLRELGANLSIARKRRKESIKAWAGRIGVSEPTLARMEQGDPGVAFGTYATALWMIGRAQAIPELAAPNLDLGALESEVRVARERSVRSPLSLEARIKSSGAAKSDPAARPGPAKSPGAS